MPGASARRAPAFFGCGEVLAAGRLGPGMSTPLMISVAGVRGIVGDSLTPAVVTRFAAAFARSLGPGPIVVGRDARVSGPMVLHAVAAGVMAAGRDVIDIGLATTPTTQMAVEHLHAAGGIILTASHNPAEWNALKFLSAAGEFLGPVEGKAVRERFDRKVGFLCKDFGEAVFRDVDRRLFQR